ncbi:MAG: hypothetical protein PHD95_05540 [Candidatus ainarchaeum sp.]|nr:hypothetical protein [Candidatus ainarchaeum sp.]
MQKPPRKATEREQTYKELQRANPKRRAMPRLQRTQLALEEEKTFRKRAEEIYDDYSHFRKNREWKKESWAKTEYSNITTKFYRINCKRFGVLKFPVHANNYMVQIVSLDRAGMPSVFWAHISELGRIVDIEEANAVEFGAKLPEKISDFRHVRMTMADIEAEERPLNFNAPQQTNFVPVQATRTGLNFFRIVLNEAIQIARKEGIHEIRIARAVKSTGDIQKLQRYYETFGFKFGHKGNPTWAILKI